MPHFYSRTQIFVRIDAHCSSAYLGVPDVLYFSLGDDLDRSWDLALDLENSQFLSKSKVAKN